MASSRRKKYWTEELRQPVVEFWEERKKSRAKRGSLCARRRSRKTVTCHGLRVVEPVYHQALIARQMEELEEERKKGRIWEMARFVNLADLARQSHCCFFVPFDRQSSRSTAVEAPEASAKRVERCTTCIVLFTCPPGLLFCMHVNTFFFSLLVFHTVNIAASLTCGWLSSFRTLSQRRRQEVLLQCSRDTHMMHGVLDRDRDRCALGA